LLLTDAYVDDKSTGAATEKGLMELQKELVRLLAEKKLNFRMESSNCTTLMNSIPMEDYPYQRDTTQLKKVKILCLVCDPNRG